MSQDLQNIKVGDIIKTDKALREVDRDSASYQEMVASIRAVGITTPISVRRMEDGTYELIDGRHRLTGAADAGFDTIPCLVFENMTEAQQLDMQIIANTHKQDTKPAQYANQLRRLMAVDSTITALDISNRIGRSAQWVQNTLKLNRLIEQAQGLVDSGEMCLSNAYQLAQLPQEEQVDWMERAVTQGADTFVPECTARVKEIRDAARKGRVVETPVFEASAKLRKAAVLKDELDTGFVAAGRDDFTEGIRWALSLDDETVASTKASWEEREAARAAEKKERALARAKAKEEKAKAAVAEAESTDALV